MASTNATVRHRRRRPDRTRLGRDLRARPDVTAVEAIRMFRRLSPAPPDRDELLALARHGLADDPTAPCRVSVGAASKSRDGRRVRPGKRAKKVDERNSSLSSRQACPPDALLVSSTSAITASRFTEMLPPGALPCRPSVNPRSDPAGGLVRRAVDAAPEAIDRTRARLSRDRQVPVTSNRAINGLS